MFINGNSSCKQETVEQVRSRTSRNDVSGKHDGRGKAGGRELFWRKRSRSLCRSSAWFVEIVAAVMLAVSAMISVRLFFPFLALFWRTRYQAVQNIQICYTDVREFIKLLRQRLLSSTPCRL